MPTGVVVSRLRTALLKRYNGRENEEENVSSYWVALRKKRLTGNSKRKH